MKKTSIEFLEQRPFFELEDFMYFSKESRIESAILSQLVDLWGDWSNLLKIAVIKNDKASWLAIWLPEEVEKQVADFWQELPSKGFLTSNLAQFLCMSAVRELVPQVEGGGCAPSPARNAALSSALVELGLLRNTSDPSCQNQFSIITHYPFKGGCEVCALQKDCPKGNGSGEDYSITLPGFERGLDIAGSHKK